MVVTLIIHVVTWQVGHNAMCKVEQGVYFKHANLESVEIISFLNEITKLKKMLVAPAFSVWKPSKVTFKDDCGE